MKIYKIIILLAISLNIGATNYYVDNTGGNDSNDGLSPATAWKTIGEVNGNTYLPGDSILLKRGETWRTTTDAGDVALRVSSAGTSENYITYGAYGTGDRPRILGSNQVTGWTDTGGNIWTAVLNYNPRTLGYGAELFCETADSILWTFNNGSLAGVDADLDWYWENNTLHLYSVEDPDTRFTSVEAPNTARAFYLLEYEYIAIDNIEIAYNTNVGIYDSYGSSNINGLRVTNCHIHHIGFRDTGQGFGLSVKRSDMYIGYNDISDCGRRNISLVVYGTTPSMHISNVVIEHNYLHDGWHTTSLDLNSVGDHTIDSIIFRNNLVYDDPDQYLEYDQLPSGVDWHSNQMFLANQGTGTMGNIWIYNNIFVGARGNSILAENVHDIYIYHNTFAKFNPNLRTNYYAGFLVASGTDNIDVKNNLFYNDGIEAIVNGLYNVSINDSATFITTEMDYNLWWKTNDVTRTFILQNTAGEVDYYFYTISQWETFKSEMQRELNSPDPSDPLFISLSLDDYNLQTGSSAIDSGTPLAFITTDYYNNPRDPVTPTIGAVEYQDADSSLAEIIYFTIDGQVSSTVDTAANTVSVVMPFGTDRSSLTPSIITTLASTISPLSGVTQDFTSPVNYTVTSGDATNDEIYAVTVSNAAASAATDILTFTIPGQVGNSVINATEHTVTVLMGYYDVLTSLTPTITMSNGATISPLSGTAQDFTNPVNYTVTAQDGITEQVWAVTVTKKIRPSLPTFGGKILVY